METGGIATARGLKIEDLATKPDFAKIPLAYRSVLEIGPFNAPCCRGRNVSYFDVIDTDAMRRRAVDVGYDPSTVPEITYVSSVADLTIIPEHFEAVVSCHSIEHQPDLVGHLNMVADLLTPGGSYFLIVPDKRYCFDHFLPESTFDEVLQAIGEQRHPLDKVLTHMALATHNDAHRHWTGDHTDPSWADSIAPRLRAALDLYARSSNSYIDVHRWQFTPDNFGQIVGALRSSNRIGLDVVGVGETPPGDLQFVAHLRRP